MIALWKSRQNIYKDRDPFYGFERLVEFDSQVAVFPPCLLRLQRNRQHFEGIRRNYQLFGRHLQVRIAAFYILTLYRLPRMIQNFNDSFHGSIADMNVLEIDESRIGIQSWLYIHLQQHTHACGHDIFQVNGNGLAC